MRKLKDLPPKGPFPQPDVVTKVVPVPTGGWDAISPLARMDPERAPILDNWVPRTGYVEIRQGYTSWVRQLADAAVETLMVRRPPLGAEEMFAAADSHIFDVTTRGSSSAVVTGLSSARWQYTNFTPSGGTCVIQAANGADHLIQYDGSSWTEPVITGLPGGASTTSIISVVAMKRRLWYILTNSTIAAFMPTDAITGPIAGTLDFGALFTLGGYLVNATSWTVDGGNGPNDYACFISSKGQVAIYGGIDPTDASNWSLVGTFRVSPPIGRRCFLRVGSDVAIITQQGILPLSQSLPFDPSADRSVAITARIQNAIQQATQSAGSNFGWQLASFPAQQLAILNVPLVENSSQVQYVMFALTGAWFRIIGWNANCFEIFNDDLYWGGNTGDVNWAWQGGLDLFDSIQADMQCAFNWFDDPGRTKTSKMIQALLTASGSITPLLSVDADFGASTDSAQLSIVQGGALWDVAQWDVDDWPAATITITDWLSAEALGHALAVRMRVNVSPSTTVVNGMFDISVFDTGQFDESIGGLAPTLQVNAFNMIMEMGGFI